MLLELFHNFLFNNKVSTLQHSIVNFEVLQTPTFTSVQYHVHTVYVYMVSICVGVHVLSWKQIIALIIAQ